MYYIVTDSSTDMPQSWVEAQHDFHIVSLSCTINGVSSVPGTSEVAKKETYRQLRSGVVIKTSAVNTATWEECFQKLLDEGQDVLCITFSSGLSGTYAAAADAAKELAPKYPNQKIIVIDSRCASGRRGPAGALCAAETANRACPSRRTQSGSGAYSAPDSLVHRR